MLVARPQSYIDGLILYAWLIEGSLVRSVGESGIHTHNAGITNTEFICGKAEDVMPDLQHPYALRGEVIGVVDPPRGGLRTLLP